MFSKVGANLLRFSTVFGLLIALIALNVLSSFVFTRFDFTEGGTYTLSDSTKKIVKNLPDKLVAKVFLSADLPPQIQQAKQTLEDTLAEYAAASGGKFSLDYVDPLKDTTAKSLADSLGVSDVALQVVEKDQQQMTRVYFALAILKPAKTKPEKSDNPLSAYEKYETVSVIQDLDKLEYNLTAVIKKMTTKDLKVVGFLTGHDEHSFSLPENNQFAQMLQDRNPRADYPFRDKLEKNYKVTSVTIDEKKPEITEINTLVVAGPQTALKDFEVKAIHAFVQGGGNAVFLLDRVSAAMGMQASVLPQDYADLLAPWGVRIEPTLVADQSNTNATFNQGFFSISLPYPLWVKSTNLSKNSVITANLDSVVLPWTSPLNIAPPQDKDLQIETLVASSDHYAILTEQDQVPAVGQDKTAPATPTPTQKTPINLDPQQKFEISTESKPPLPLAVLAQKKGAGKVVIVGNSDFPSKMFNEASGGEVFLLNAIDAFTLGDELIAIRSKQISDRPLEETRDAVKNLIRWGNILLMPVLFVSYGFLRRLLRNVKKQALLKS